LELEFAAELHTLLWLQKQLASGHGTDGIGEMNALAGAMRLRSQLRMWEAFTGRADDYPGLVAFHKSQHYRAMPYTNVKCNLMAERMIDKQAIRSGDVADMNHASTLMPYSDLYVTDRAMAATLRKKGWDRLYNTTVCYVGDGEIIDAFFNGL
jgi:hypothetical protein